jgi:hypothetical protein
MGTTMKGEGQECAQSVGLLLELLIYLVMAAPGATHQQPGKLMHC